MIRSWGLKDVSKQEIEKKKMTHEGKKRKLNAQRKKTQNQRNPPKGATVRLVDIRVKRRMERLVD